LFVILAVITAVLLAIVVLIQESKGGGLASNVSSANSVLGVRKTTDFVEKATWTLAALLVVFSVATSFFVHQNTDSTFDVTNIKTTAPAPAAPATPAAPANQAAPATQGTAAPAAQTPAPAATK
ncbi:MAG: preprotein translocase subunit SecG, partial [Alloprevotella sp.]|nr:preprotein translocase subunit SecG [Alloprevotella sp.]